MFALLYLVLITCEERIAFQSGINTITYEEKNAPSEVSFYTTNEKILVAITQIDRTSTKVQVEVPIKNKQQNIDGKQPLYFLSDNCRILVKFSQNSTIKFSTVTIPSALCASDISAIIDVYSENLYMEGTANNQDKCVFYATAEANRNYNVTSNGLLGNTKLTVYRQRIDETAFDSFTSDGKTGRIGSDINRPLLFRLTTSTDGKYGNITIKLKSEEKIDVSLRNIFIGEPARLKVMASEIGYMNNWWIILFGSIAPIALLLAWAYTFVNLRKKEPVVVDEGLYDDLKNDEL